MSSRSGEGIAELRAAVEEALPKPAVEVHAVIPYDRGDLVAAIHESGMLSPWTIQKRMHRGDARVSERLAAELAPFTAHG